MIAELLRKVQIEADTRHDEVILRVIQFEGVAKSLLVDGIRYLEHDIALGLNRARGPDGEKCRCPYCLHLAVYTNLNITIHRAEKQLRNCYQGPESEKIQAWLKTLRNRRQGVILSARKIAPTKPGRLSLSKEE